MNQRNMLKMIHLAGTIWFVVCLGYLFVLVLHQAGFNWWLIFSLSGHSALLIFLLISLYLFTIFGAGGEEQGIAVEHPLTTTGPYLALYVSAPILGVLAGAVAMAGETRITQFLTGIALGTLAVTFLTWVIVDPLASMLEALAPTSREHRFQRLAEGKRQQEERQRNREELLGRLFAQQEQDRRRWQVLLTPDAEKLTVLLSANRVNFEQAERQAVGIGVRAWQIGGLDCMRRLHDMAMELYKEKYQNLTITDHISNWWDGIGSWRNPAVGFCPPA
jgi:protein-S-isoprenylcysteine O-methyltransferase Ste14